MGEIDGAGGDFQRDVGLIINDVGKVEDFDHTAGVAEGTIDGAEDMIDGPDVRKEGASDGIKEDYVCDSKIKEVVTTDDENKNKDESDLNNEVHGKIAPHGDFGDAEGGFASSLGGLFETSALEGFAGVGFHAHDIGDRVGELAGLLILGVGEGFVYVASFIESNGGDGDVGDGESE